MKKIGIIHSQIAAVIASMGHNDLLTIVDAGFPIPASVQRIDLALKPGLPSFLETLEVVTSELFVERFTVADEILTYSPHILEGMRRLLPEAAMQTIPHVDFKQLSASSRAIIRTAEFTPYANVILTAGAWGFKL